MSAPSANPAVPNRVTSFEYDANNAGRFLTKITKPSGGSDFVTRYSYDSKWGHIVKKIDPNGLVTTFQYNDFGRLSTTILPDGTSTQMAYGWSQGNSDAPSDAVYYFTKTHTGEGSATVFYDKFNRVRRTVSPAMNGGKRYSDNIYDAKGFLYQTTAPYFSGSQANSSIITTFSYDALGRILSKSNSAKTISYTYDGRVTKVMNSGTQKTITKEVNVLGNPIHVTDPSGTIDYHYNSAGKITSVVALGRTTSMEYDPAGNRKKLTDPNAGISTYRYNAYGELISQTDARNNQYTMAYDVAGRLLSKTLVNGNETSDYVYNNTSGQNGFGQLKSVSSSTGTVYQYSYDNLYRLSSKTETIDGKQYAFNYHYNSTGKLDSYTYPSGYAIKYDYYPNGNLKTVMQGTKVLWKALEDNALGQLTDYSLGNGLTTHKTFDNYGMPREIVTGNIQDLSYVFDPATGNLNSRKDNIYNLTETFGYDALLHSRLTSWHVNNAKSYTISYNNNGSINTKTDITTYASEQYSNNNFAVSQIPATDNSYFLQATPQQISYTPFNKIKTIKQFEPAPNAAHYYYETFDYGPFNQRKKTLLYHDNNLLRTKIFVSSDYEIEKTPDGHTRKLHYLSGGDGLFAIFVQNNGADSMYYIHKDYLGSYQTITDANGHVVERLSFDPWGRRRNAQDWTFNNVPSSYLFDRGFTGHEHMGHFALINMNGRVYDPVLGDFLSPDPFVQAPANTQNYNRYGYALNNPLKYTDPTGYQTAAPPGGGNWLNGGGGNWGENGMGFGGNVNWDCFSNTNTYINWQGRQVSYMDTPVNIAPGLDDKDVITISGEGTGYLLAGIISRNISISDLFDANSITIGVTYPEPWSSVIINGRHVGEEMIDITIGHGAKAGGESGRGETDWGGMANATLGLIGGVAEMAVAGGVEYFSVGLATPLSGTIMFDGAARVIMNAQWLGLYVSGNTGLANAYPTSLGGLAGKSIDMAFGAPADRIGYGQAIGSWGNDLSSFVMIGGNGLPLFDLYKTPSLETGFKYGFSMFNYPYSWYNDKPTK